MYAVCVAAWLKAVKRHLENREKCSEIPLRECVLVSAKDFCNVQFKPALRSESVLRLTHGEDVHSAHEYKNYFTPIEQKEGFQLIYRHATQGNIGVQPRRRSLLLNRLNSSVRDLTNCGLLLVHLWYECEWYTTNPSWISIMANKGRIDIQNTKRKRKAASNEQSFILM